MADADGEQDWVMQSRNGNPAAFESLVRRHQHMIHSLTYRMTGSLADAEDLAQETFIRAYRQLDTYQSASKFSTWLYRIAVNACLNWRRREARRAQIHATWSRSNEDGLSSINDSTDEMSRRVQKALMQLPAKQRAAIILTVYDEHNHAAAARILGCSETTVSWRVFAARRKLKRLLSPAGGANG